MNPTKDVKALVAPFLSLLDEKIRERGFTELEVEEALSWDRRHIRQLMAGRKALHVDEVLSVLDVIGVEPAAFYAELYGIPPAMSSRRSPSSQRR